MTLSVIVAGTEFQLDGGATLSGTGRIYWQAEQGVGLAPLQRLVHRAPRQHGDTDVGRRLEPREFREIWLVIADTWADMYDSRDFLLNIFKPLESIVVTFKWLLPNGKERRLDTFALGGLTMDQRVQDGPFQLDIVLDLRADDPTIYDPVLKTAIFRTAAISNLSFPVAFPVGFGSSIVNQGQTINYPGSWISFPIIKFTGPLDSPKIENTALSPVEKLQIDASIPIGETWTIDLTPLKKTVTVDGTGVNKIGTLSDDSDLGTFRFEVDPVVVDGDNVFQVTAGGSDVNSKVELRWTERYVGL